MEDEVPEMLGKFWQRMVENKRFIKKKSQTSTKNKFMNDIHSLLLEETEDREDEENEEFRKWSVDDIINQLSRKLSKVTECKNIQMTKLVSKLTHNNRFLCSMENEYSYDADDVLIDMKLKNPFSKKFIEFLISKHEKDKSKIKGLELETCIEKELPIYGCPSSQKLNKIILTRAEEEKNSNPDDVVCLICNDGDYEDNDLIVYCSMCQMTVHQNCYGIVDLPEGDWVCYPCRTYKENSREIECLLCPVKGGAMKPSTIKKFQSPYNIICKIRNLQTDKKNSPPSDLEQIGLNNNYYLNENLQDLTQEKTNIERINFFDDLTYSDKTTEKQEKTLNQDIFTNTPAKKSFYSQKEETEKGTLQNSMTNSSPKKGRGRNRKIKNKLKKKNHLDQNNNQSRGEIDDFDINNAKKYAWVHLSCALWLPEVQIGNYDKKDDIKGINIFKSGIDCIPKERFNETCSICSFSNYGPTVKCENNSCSVRFHVECARINKYQLEKGSSYSGEVKITKF
jgi:hypothetical protein